MKIKYIAIPFLGVLIAGLLLAFASGAKAALGDPAFTLGGILSVSGSTGSIQGQSFVVDSSTTCTDLTSATVPCTDLNGKLVKVMGYISKSDSKYYATSIQAVPDTTVFTVTGTLTAINGDLWTVGTNTFLVKNITLPPYFGPKDTVMVTYQVVNGVYVATAVTVVQTFVGNKVESNRCDNRLKDQPAVTKLAKALIEDPKKLANYFCLGFGVGEIKLAYKLAGNGYTPAMLLAIRANGMGWGQIKHLVASTQQTSPQSQPNNHGNNGKGNHGNGPEKNKPNHGKN